MFSLPLVSPKSNYLQTYSKIMKISDFLKLLGVKKLQLNQIFRLYALTKNITNNLIYVSHINSHIKMTQCTKFPLIDNQFSSFNKLRSLAFHAKEEGKGNAEVCSQFLKINFTQIVPTTFY